MPEEKSLEEKVDEEKTQTNNDKSSLVSKVLDLGYYGLVAAGATAVGIATVGPTAPLISGAISGIEMLFGFFKGGKSIDSILKNSLKSYSSFNFIVYPALAIGNIYPLIPNADLAGKAARALFGMFVHAGAFLGLSKATSHLIENKLNPKGLVNKVKDNFMPEYLRLAFGFSPGIALYANGIETLPVLGYNAPVLLLNMVPLMIYNLLNPIKKPEQKTQPEPAYKPSAA